MLLIGLDVQCKTFYYYSLDLNSLCLIDSVFTLYEISNFEKLQSNCLCCNFLWFGTHYILQF